MTDFNAKPEKSHILRSITASAAVLGCSIFLLLRSASSIQETAADSQAQSLRQAILRSAVNCYATEGRYPESLAYLKDHYGIRWNEKKYAVDYEITGSNLAPSVTVIPLKKLPLSGGL